MIRSATDPVQAGRVTVTYPGATVVAGTDGSWSVVTWWIRDTVTATATDPAGNTLPGTGTVSAESQHLWLRWMMC
ncbi:hypothetical protein ACT4ZG_02135 [Acinetobacter baumannii]